MQEDRQIDILVCLLTSLDEKNAHFIADSVPITSLCREALKPAAGQLAIISFQTL